MVWGSAELLIHAGIHTPSLNIHATFTDSTDRWIFFVPPPDNNASRRRFFKSSQKFTKKKESHFELESEICFSIFKPLSGAGKATTENGIPKGCIAPNLSDFPIWIPLPSTSSSSTQPRDDAKLAFLFVVKNWGAIRRRLRWLHRRRPHRLSFPFLCAYVRRNSDLGMAQHRKGSCFDFPCFERRRIGTELRKEDIEFGVIKSGDSKPRLPKPPRTVVVWTMWVCNHLLRGRKGGER